MPQATDELRARWHDDNSDDKAWRQLANNFLDDRGLLRPKMGYTPTPDDLSAIDYLVQEWDYAWDPTPVKVKRVTIYDPPSGWKYGFPKIYNRVNNESLAETLLRDGYPQQEIDYGGDKYVRFWEKDVKDE